MNYKKLLAPYLWRLRLEALAKSLLAGLIVGFAFGVVATVWCRYAIIERDILTMMLYSIYVALAFTPVAYLFYRPNIKKAAKRVDKTGLFDRASTMLALQDDDSYIASVQREDAVARLKKVKASKIPFNITYKPLAAIGAMIVALSLVSMIPYRTLQVDAAPIPEEIVQESRIIANLIAQLRTLIEEADVPEDIKLELTTIVDELEASVDDYDTTLEKAAKISEARTKILNIINRISSDTDTIGGILAEDEATKELGEAITSKDSEKLTQAIENIRNEMFNVPEEEREQWFKDMAEKLNSAIEQAGGIDEENPDPILGALKDLADAFAGAGEMYEDETIENPGDAAAGMGGLGLSDAEQTITEENEKQNQIEEGLKDIIGAIEDARDELFGTDGETEDDEVTTDDPVTDDENGDENTGTEDENGPGGEGVGPGGEEDEDDDESFFDPGSLGGSFGDDDYELTEDDFNREIYEQIIVGGDVNYKDVYLDYYASALEAIARSEIPDDLKDVIINYFTSLE